MADDGMVRFLLDQLDDEGVTVRSMFGGHGFYRDGRMFALVYDEAVYMKVSRDEVDTSERPPFQPRGGRTFPSFRAVSAEVLDDQAALFSLARKSQQAAGP